MKRLIVAALVFFAVLPVAVADTSKRNSALPIAGFVDKIESFTITEVEATSITDDEGEGMPFNLDATNVQESTVNIGRTIARWSVNSNHKDFLISVTAPDLESEDKNTVSYKLIFNCYFGYLDVQGVSQTAMGSFEVSSGTTSSINLVDNIVTKDEGGNSLAGDNTYVIWRAESSPIRFMLTQDNAGISPGNYSADVTITVSGG